MTRGPTEEKKSKRALWCKENLLGRSWCVCILSRGGFARRCQYCNQLLARANAWGVGSRVGKDVSQKNTFQNLGRLTHTSDVYLHRDL